MIDMSSRTARVAVTAGLVSALTLGGGAITALAEVSKADVPAVAVEQVPVATPVEDNAVAPAAEVSKDQAVASLTSKKSGIVKYYDSFQSALDSASNGNDVAADDRVPNHGVTSAPKGAWPPPRIVSYHTDDNREMTTWTL